MGINRSKIARQLLQYGGSASGRTGFEGSPEMGGRGTTETYGFDQSDSSDNVRAERRKEIAKGLGRSAVELTAQTAFPQLYYGYQAAKGLDKFLKATGLVDPNVKVKGPVPTTESDSIPVMPLVSPAVGIASQMDEKPSELAKYIASIRAAQPNPFMLDPRFAAADGGRVAFGLGSLVRKITKPIKKLVKSDVGKAALLAAGAYGLSRPGAMDTIGTKLGGLKDYIVGKQAMDYGEVASKGLLQRLGLTKTPGKFDLTKKGIAAAIGIPSLLGYFATPDEEDEETLEQAIARTYGTDRGIDIPGIRRAALGYSDPNELYFKLPEAFRLRAAEGGRIGYANGGYSQDIIDEYKANVKEGYKGSLRKYILEFYGPEYLKPMAKGGRVGFLNGGTPVFTKGSILKDKDVMRVFEDADKAKSIISKFIEEERAPDVGDIMEFLKFQEKAVDRTDKTVEKIESRDDYEEIDPYGTYDVEKGKFIKDTSKLNARKREPIEIKMADLIMQKKEKELEELDNKFVKMLEDKGLTKEFEKNQSMALEIMDTYKKYQDKLLAEQAEKDSMLDAFGYGEIKRAKGGIARLGAAEGGTIDDEYFARKDKELERLIEKGMSLEEALQKVFPGTKSSVEFTREELGLEPLPEGKAEGGIMDLGGKEMDLRGGGFVPIGAKEKADDVPARLSKNEFVFTADAVRGAGGGSVEKGAQKMYNTMKQLEEMV